MIERQSVDGKEATVTYIDSYFKPVDKDDAVYIKVIYDEGGVVFLMAEELAKQKTSGDK